MFKKRAAITAAVIMVIVLALTSIASAGGLNKKIGVWFKNIKLIVNGKTVITDSEPFIYNDTTYVPLRVIGQALDKDIKWDGVNNTVIISDKPDQNNSSEDIDFLKAQLYYKDHEIQMLRQQLNAQLKGKNPEKDLKDYLEDEYSTWERMAFEFDVDGDEDEIELTIEIDLDDDGYRWNRTDEVDIEDWLDDIYNYVEDEYPDADFSGSIIDIDSDRTLVEFKVSRDRLRVEFLSGDFDELQNDLNEIFGEDLDESYDDSFGNIVFEFEVDGDEDDEEIKLTISFDYSRYENEWNMIEDTTAAEEWLQDVVDYILRDYDDYDITGEIVDEDDYDTLASFEVDSRGNIDVDWDY